MISPAEAVRLMVKWWWVLALSSLLGLAGAIYQLSRTVPTYEAKMILAPQRNFLGSSRTSSGSLAGILGALQGDTESDLVRIELLLKSERLAHALHQDPSTLRSLFPDRWDADRKIWRRPGGLAPVFLWLIGYDAPNEPAVDEVEGLLKARLLIKTEQQAFRSISFRDRDPKVSQKMLDHIIGTADSILRTDDRSRVSSMIDYTTQRLQDITLQQQQQGIASILINLEQQRMLINSSKFYSFDLIQGSEVESFPSEPKSILYLAIGATFPPFLIIFSYLLLAPAFRKREPAGRFEKSEE